MTIDNHKNTPKTENKTILTDHDSSLTKEAIQEGWSDVMARMRHDLGDSQWRCWIKNLKIIGFDKDTVLIGAESKLIKTRVSSQYQDRLQLCPESSRQSIESPRRLKR